MTCATRSTPASCAASSAGARSTATSRRASRRPSPGTGSTSPGGPGPRTASKPSTHPRASDHGRVRQGSRARRNPHPRLGGVRAARARRRARLVQGELAAREDARPRPARLRARAEQHLVQRRRRHDPRHPRRALGQVGLGRHRPDLRRVGRPARGPQLRCRVHHGARPVAGDLRAPRRRQLLPDPRTRHRIHVPGQRPLVARRVVLVPEPRRRDRRDRLAHSARPGRDLTEGPGPPPPAGGDTDSAAQDPRARRRRAARPRAARRVRRRRAHRVRDPRRAGCGRCGPGDGAALARLRHDHQRGRLHRSRPRRDGRRTTECLVGQRRRRRRPRGRGRREPHHPGARLQRLRLRRGRGPALPRRRPGLPARRIRPEQSRRRRRRRHRRPALHRPHVMGHRRGRQLRAHHGLARRARRRPARRGRSDRPPHLHRRHRPRHPPPAGHARALRASTTSPARANRPRGPRSPGRCSPSPVTTPHVSRA